MNSIPLFDTNIFSNRQEGNISENDWRGLLRRRPRKGWPLSAITVLELLAGIYRVSEEKFRQPKEALAFAWELSKGHVLAEPRVMICRHILQTRFPLEPISETVLSKLMDIASRARTKEELTASRVPYRRSIYKRGEAGMDAKLIDELMSGPGSPKRQWVGQIERQLTEIYPGWREYLQSSGLRLPEEIRKRIESPKVWELPRMKFSESILTWLGANGNSPNPSEFADRIDAVMRLTSWVVRECVLARYAYDKHDSDIYDQFQLHYLADERYVFVTNDEKLRERTGNSSQANRILSFDQFIRTL